MFFCSTFPLAQVLPQKCLRVRMFAGVLAERWPLLSAGCETAGGQRRAADDRGQSHCPLHREAAQREEV